MRDTFRIYYRLTKPGIIYGNVIAVIAGFFLASKGSINLRIFFGSVIGVALIIAASCVVNNYIDRKIDIKMERTKNRAIVTGRITKRGALTYAIILGVIGFIVLALTTNVITVILGIVAVIFYVVLYGVAKRWSVHGTFVGSISGALPPVAGYVAVTSRIDTAAVLLALIWITWQMPHFFAIAMYRRKDYANAGIPVLPVKKGMETTKRQIILYVMGFAIACILMTLFGYTGIIYLSVMAVVSLVWVVLGLRGLRTNKDSKWARGMFFYSLGVMLILCLMLSIGSVIA